ncbi:hypothetical protein ACKUB1_10985 [Methanospirillum stamsii]|uniref:Uncharacterized protein n=1 Tax=Methanospirillum stamsii TaxID=1277351 RepID=A0A2V2NFD2_9EURY|nr:hypothetical protein [Methanospirillum stamsii]PWR75088.1 hypothetical protein DLD82_06370 [Methanospirillum stamsii]
MNSKYVPYILILGLFFLILHVSVFAAKIPVSTTISDINVSTDSGQLKATDQKSTQSAPIKVNETKTSGLVGKSAINTLAKEESIDEISQKQGVAAQSLLDMMQLTEDEIKSGPYEYSQWVVIGGTAASIDEFDQKEFLSPGHQHHHDLGLGGALLPGATVKFYISVPINPDAHIRYVRLTDHGSSCTIEKILVKSGLMNIYESDNVIRPEPVETLRTYYFDLGEYRTFDQGMEVIIHVKCPETTIGWAGYDLVNAGAFMEW